MTHYLIAIHRPDGYEPNVVEDEAMHRDITHLNQEMIVAGVRLFVGGLEPPRNAHVLRPMLGGEVTIASGPYFKTGEHISGLWVLDLDSLDDALAWGRKAALACRAPVEVRPFH